MDALWFIVGMFLVTVVPFVPVWAGTAIGMTIYSRFATRIRYFGFAVFAGSFVVNHFWVKGGYFGPPSNSVEVVPFSEAGFLAILFGVVVGILILVFLSCLDVFRSRF